MQQRGHVVRKIDVLNAFNIRHIKTRCEISINRMRCAQNGITTHAARQCFLRALVKLCAFRFYFKVFHEIGINFAPVRSATYSKETPGLNSTS